MRLIPPLCLGHPLHERLQAFAFDSESAAMPFTGRLARDNMWTPDFAQRVCGEYKRFLFLACTADHVVTPSEAVDEAWHLHLIYTKSYWEDLCGGVLERPLHHVPTEGGEQQQAFYKDCYQRTLASYELAFGTKPPADIWPDVDAQFRSAGLRRTVDASQFWVVKKPGRTFYLMLGVILIALGLGDVGASAHAMVPTVEFVTGLGVSLWSIYTPRDVALYAARDIAGCGGDGGCGGCGGCGGR